MSKPAIGITQIISETAIFRLPRIIAFNRLETRARTVDFTRSLRAEVRDPLWMLTRQWQFGEFNGEDAASPVTSRIAFQHEHIDRLSLKDQKALEFDGLTIPLETRVERERIPLTVPTKTNGDVYSDVLFAVQWGKQFSRLLRAALLDGHYSDYIAKFPIRVLPDASLAKGTTGLDPAALEIQTCAGAKVADGVAIVLAVENGTHDTWVDSVAGGDKDALKTIAAQFADACRKKFRRLFTQPDEGTDSAWRQNHLEYQFAVAGAPVQQGPQTVLLADQYSQGRVDWYSFDSVTDRSLPREPEVVPIQLNEEVQSFLPSNVRFKGQPQPRFWEMEEAQTDFGKIETSTTGLLHMLLAEFGLIYSNDWFMLPHPMPINTVCEIRGIVVDDTFGRHTYIRPAGRGPETAWQRFAMFHLTEKGRARPEANRFYLVPAVGKVLESEPLERVNFMRDEMANMVWGVERTVPSQTGIGISGYETTTPSEPNKLPPLTDDNVKIGYVLGTRVPKNWIPFIAVHAEGSVSEIRLQRARMVGGEPPRSWILREPKSPYFIEEEEVPRTGVYVDRSWQRARWLGGKTFIWVGRRKTAGRGEGWSQLVFDQVVDLKKA
jgi:hypothetical protein